MEIFNNVIAWYLFLIATSFFGILARFSGNEWFRGCGMIIFALCNIRFIEKLEYLQELQNFLISLFVLGGFACLFYFLLKNICNYKIPKVDLDE